MNLREKKYMPLPTEGITPPTAQPVPTPTGPTPAAAPKPAPAAGFDPNSGAARTASSKVAPHITSLGGAPKINIAPAGGQTGQVPPQQPLNAQQAYNPNAGTNSFWGQQGGPTKVPPKNQQQYKMNDKLVLDFALLDNAAGYRASFASTRLGQFLESFCTKMQLALNVGYDAEVGAYIIEFGNAHILWVTGMTSMNSPAYTLPMRIMNPQAFANMGSKLTQWVMRGFNGGPNVNPDDGYAVIFDDDIEYNFQALCFFMTKLAGPNEPQTHHITEDQYLNQRAYGFHIVDTRAIKNGGNGNQAYYNDVKNNLKGFFDANSPSAMKVAGDEFIAIAVTDTSNQWNAYNNGWGWQQGMGYGNAFGNNGGFGIGGYQQPREKILGAVKYYVTQESNPNFPNGGKYNVAHLTEICEMSSIVVENFIKYILIHMAQCGYAIQLELDLSKVTQNLRENLRKYFQPANTYNGYFGGGVSYSALTAYVKRDGAKLVRIAPSFLTLRVFKSMHPEYDKDPKFPKDLTKYESQVYFEECKRKEGYIQMLNTGSIRLVFNSAWSQQMLHEYNGHLYAINQNLTFDEMVAMQQNGQQSPQQQPNNGWQQNGWGGAPMGGWGGMGPQPQYAFGGYPSYGQNGQPMGWQQNGMWGNAPMYQPGMMGGMGMGPMGMPMGGGYPPVMGTQPYPVNQGQPNGGKKGQQAAQPYFAPQGGMMGGMGMGPMGMPMGGGMYPNNGMMGGYPPMYQPGMMGGAFPQSNGGPGGYIPN